MNSRFSRRKRAPLSAFNPAEELETPRRNAVESAGENVDGEVSQCLEQVEICCEQARDAARFKRFLAAAGLFSTAVALCRRALSSTRINDASRSTLKECVDRISGEMAAHAQLARSMNRPLHTPLQTPLSDTKLNASPRNCSASSKTKSSTRNTGKTR